MELSARTKSWACIGFLVFASSLSLFAQGDHFNARGNILIADQFNNRVIEVDRHGNIVWQFGLGPADFSPASAGCGIRCGCCTSRSCWERPRWQ